MVIFVRAVLDQIAEGLLVGVLPLLLLPWLGVYRELTSHAEEHTDDSLLGSPSLTLLWDERDVLKLSQRPSSLMSATRK